ncbi:MAG TPA: hypothetical protein VGG28_32915 [Kofleriaceae bacterium]|jgi:hypothetical protein
MPDPAPIQQPPVQQQESPDYKFPSGGPVSGLANLAGTVAGMVGKVPLVGSFMNEGEAVVDTGTALYHGVKAKNAYNAGNVGEGGKQIDAGESDLNAAEGHLINAIPLVGFARALM